MFDVIWVFKISPLPSWLGLALRNRMHSAMAYAKQEPHGRHCGSTIEPLAEPLEEMFHQINRSVQELLVCSPVKPAPMSQGHFIFLRVIFARRIVGGTVLRKEKGLTNSSARETDLPNRIVPSERTI